MRYFYTVVDAESKWCYVIKTTFLLKSTTGESFHSFKREEKKLWTVYQKTISIAYLWIISIRDF